MLRKVKNFFFQLQLKTENPRADALEFLGVVIALRLSPSQSVLFK